LDVAPTILEILDVDPPSSFEGISVTPWMLEAGSLAPKVAHAHSSNTGAAAIKNLDYKYISPADTTFDALMRTRLRSTEPLIQLPRDRLVGEQLFDLRVDPGESTILEVGSRSDLGIWFRDEVEKHASLCKKKHEELVRVREPDVVLTEEEQQRLRALGYVE
jgi:arylsulfatase A-like enzyme